VTEPESAAVLRRKLELLRIEQAKAVDPEMKFNLIERIAEAEAMLARVSAPDPSSEPKAAPTRLPGGAPELFGRERELEALDAAWANDSTHVITIIAWGGVGKTALLHEFRNRLCRRDEPVWVFDWSFYSQGTRDRGAVSADNFVREALHFFGDPVLAEGNASPWTKGARLAELIGRQRTLLLLDGLEPLQEPPGAKGRVGALRDPAVAALLRGLAARNRGLCVVSSRVGVGDLAAFERTTAPRWELERLPTQAGVALLRSVLGKVRGTDEEVADICEAVNGHALSLELLGSYIRRAHGNLTRWREIDLSAADADQGGHAFRVMDAYVHWLAGAGAEGQRELEVLRMLGLFDRPADPGCIAALRREPAIPGLNEGVVGLDREGWRALVSSLEEARLLEIRAYEAVAVFGYDEATAQAAGEMELPKGEPQRWSMAEHGSVALVLDAHPLVREYFGETLQRTNEAAWRDGHRRLFEYLCDAVPYWPDGVAGLQPLYQALVHGCRAGRMQEALAAVFHDRILRGARAYSIKQLGAFGAELGALANFFEHAWDRPASELGPGDRGWLLNEAAFRLRGVGRLSEALEPMRAGLEMAVALKDWRNAAQAACNLSELERTLGRIAAAVADATQAVAHADLSGDEFMRLVSRTILADARLAAGELEHARALFEQAEAMEAQRWPSAPELSSLGSHQYCDLLLLTAERAAWRAGSNDDPPAPELAVRCVEVFERATRALEISDGNHWTLDIALDHLTLGRAATYAALLHTRAPTATLTLTLAHAREHLELAVETLRKAGAQEFLAKGLLTRAWLHHLDNHPDLAHADLDEAYSIAERGPMPLIQADIHLHRARLFHDHTALTAAATLIHDHGYRRRIPELEAAQRDAVHWPTPDIS
jgi:tetratricopeptide (TPR) repeat protein